jgi:hypothetical protein
MTYGLGTGRSSVALHGADGNLVCVRVRVEARLLEDLLEALANASFPINPEIRHGHSHASVEFPAYDRQIAEIRQLIYVSGIRVELDLANMLTAIA